MSISEIIMFVLGRDVVVNGMSDSLVRIAASRAQFEFENRFLDHLTRMNTRWTLDTAVVAHEDRDRTARLEQQTRVHRPVFRVWRSEGETVNGADSRVLERRFHVLDVFSLDLHHEFVIHLEGVGGRRRRRRRTERARLDLGWQK
jgi:hypothetical protein